MRFFTFRQKIYPLFALFSCVFLMVFGLCTARNINCSYFLLGCLLWLFIFIPYKKILRVIPMMTIIGGLFSLIAYFVYGRDNLAAIAMANRFASIFLVIIIGMNVEPVDLTRNLSTLKMPRGITLGMLIASSFPPILATENKRVREAMKTRGAGSALNPKILYRAYLVPFVTRIVNISDTLSLSIETRGFSLEKIPYTIYKKQTICFADIVFVLGLIIGAVLTVSL